MQDVKITNDCYVPKENVKFYVAYQSKTVINYVRRMIKEGKVFEYQGRKKRASVVFLKTGEIILTNISITTLNKRMNDQGAEEVSC